MEVEEILKEFKLLEDTEESHYWRWQLLGCFLKNDMKELERINTQKKLAKRSNRKIIDAIVGVEE